MKLEDLIEQQEAWARELRTMAKEARDSAELWRSRAAEADDQDVKRRHEGDAKTRILFAARFDHMAAEVEAEIARLRKMDESGGWTASG